MPETEDLYAILHLHPSAHPDVIQTAYRKLALLYHPDKNPSPEATEMMASVNRAYAVLSDPEQRAEYDRRRAAQAGSGSSRHSAASTSQPSRPQSGAPRNPTGYFTLGSTKSEVAEIHGPPHDVSIDRRIREEVWHYGSDDAIEFDLDTGKVQGWSNIRGNLRIRLLPGPNVTSANFFVIGNHRDEVARLHGTPPVLVVRQEYDWECWLYPGETDINHVEFSFSTGRVASWENNDGTLRVRRSDSTTRASTVRRGASTSSSTNWRILSNEFNNVGIEVDDISSSNSWLIVRFKDRQLELIVAWGFEIAFSETTTVNWQINDGLAWQQSWHVSSDRRGIFMPATEIAETLRTLLDSTLRKIQEK